MAVTSPPSPPETAPLPRARDASRAGVQGWSVCPYLIAPGATWRSAVPVRQQLCSALEPPSPLALEKQQRLCVREAHTGCPTFAAATGAAAGGSLHATAASPGAPPLAAGVTRWSLVRTTPVILEPVRSPSVVDRVRRTSAPQLALGGILAVALAAVVVARLPPPDGTPAAAVLAASPSLSPARVAPSIVASPRPTPTRRPSPSPAASPAPSFAPSPSPTPAVRTYRVVAGDTLYGIAAQYATTIEAIVDLNRLRSTELRIGQVLRIPPAGG